jgi:predicted nucleotidyltransferase component of viral defense system
MIQQAYITAWRATAPWQDDAQIEQDLVLSRAVVEIFRHPDLAKQVALRGGTALNKLFIQPPSRYSEDIDLVQTVGEPSGPLIDLLRGVLDPWLGKPSRTITRDGLTLLYRFSSEVPPVQPLRLKLEINTREHFTLLGLQQVPMLVENPWFRGSASIQTYCLNELMGTKMRALFQRRKGRDLFDLWLCLSQARINPQAVVECLLHYLEQEQHPVSRAQYEQNLHDKQTDPVFTGDITPLLNASVTYDPAKALQLVHDLLVPLIPGEPWRGANKPDAASIDSSAGGIKR